MKILGLLSTQQNQWAQDIVWIELSSSVLKVAFLILLLILLINNTIAIPALNLPLPQKCLCGSVFQPFQ